MSLPTTIISVCGCCRRFQKISGAQALHWEFHEQYVLRVALRIPGIEDTNQSYNALNSALAVNFNTVSAVRSGNKVHSAEKQTRSPRSRSASSGCGALRERAASA